MVSVEIYFDDLSEEKQEELLEAVGVETPEEMNWDICQVATVDFEEDQ